MTDQERPEPAGTPAWMDTPSPRGNWRKWRIPDVPDPPGDAEALRAWTAANHAWTAEAVLAAMERLWRTGD